jgi:hypothetical protein
MHLYRKTSVCLLEKLRSTIEQFFQSISRMLFGHQNMMFSAQFNQTVTLPSIGQINHKNLAFKTLTRLQFFFHFLSNQHPNRESGRRRRIILYYFEKRKRKIRDHWKIKKKKQAYSSSTSISCAELFSCTKRWRKPWKMTHEENFKLEEKGRDKKKNENKN